MLIVGATRGRTHDEAEAMLRTIRQNGKLPEFPKPVYVPPMDSDI